MSLGVSVCSERSFFGNRIISAWNSLINDIVISPTVACFKHRLAKLNFALYAVFICCLLPGAPVSAVGTAFVSCRHFCLVIMSHSLIFCFV